MTTSAILMIHGLWSRPSVFGALRADLEAIGIHSAAVTLPGHDRPAGTEKPDELGHLKIEDYLASLERSVAALESPIVILGHSAGALFAQLLAARLKPGAVRGLILLATAPSAQTVMGAIGPSSLNLLFRVARRWGWWEEALKLDDELARWAIFNGVPEADIRPALADFTWDSGAVLRQIAFPLLDRAHGSTVSYRQLTMPSLILVGREDRVAPPATSRKTARLLAEAGSRIDYEEWPDIGHWLFHEAARRKLVPAIRRFMGSLEE